MPKIFNVLTICVFGGIIFTRQAAVFPSFLVEMQRILSLETSRSSNLTSEFVTKRLCCSFILTVAFFAVIGGKNSCFFGLIPAKIRWEQFIVNCGRSVSLITHNLESVFIFIYSRRVEKAAISTVKCTYQLLVGRCRCELI